MHLQVKLFMTSGQDGFRDMQEQVNRWLGEHLAQAIASIAFTSNMMDERYMCHITYIVGDVEGFKPVRGH